MEKTLIEKVEPIYLVREILNQKIISLHQQMIIEQRCRKSFCDNDPDWHQQRAYQESIEIERNLKDEVNKYSDALYALGDLLREIYKESE
jgi:hypothetical protein